MRILRVAQDIFPEVVGGAPYHIHALSRDQAANGHEVTILTVSDTVDERKEVLQDGYTMIKHPPKLEILGNKMFSNTIGSMRNADSYDIIHVHSHLFFSSNIAAIYSKFTDIPLAVTCHGLISQRGPLWFSRAHLRTLGKLTYDAADIVFCYTDVERSRLRNLGVNAEVQVINNGVDTSRFTPTGAVHPKIAEADGPAIVFVGRLVDGKRPQDALAAFKTIQDTCPDARLFFCGNGPLRNQLEGTASAAGLDNAVEFLGHVPYEKMPTVFRAADLFVLPSRTEGFPRTLMEALACETPVVSSRLEQTADIVGRAGETVKVGDVSGLADSILNIIRDSDRLSALATEGCKIINDRYDWEDTVRQTTRELQCVTEVDESVGSGEGITHTEIPIAGDDST